MKTLKGKSIFLSIALVLVLSASFIISGFLSSSKQLSTRTIDVDSIGTLSYEEKVEGMLNNFDVYSYDIDENYLSFNGEITRAANYFSTLDFLSTNPEDEITQKYATRLDLENEKFILIIDYYRNGILVETTEQETVPLFDNEKNDYFIMLDDGQLLSVSETMNTDNMENCIALVDDAALLLAAALAITIVAAAPYVANVVTTVVTKVVCWVRSFFWWLRNLFVKTVVSQVVTQVASPSITIANTTYRTEAKTKDEIKALDPTRYFAAFADPTNGKMYITVVSIGEAAAVAILNNPIVVPCIGDPNRTMIASTYTFNEFNALRVASVVGLNVRTPAGTPEIHGKGGYFWHYHTISSAITTGKNGIKLTSNPHSFFGLPV